jgi:hypothetical protein
MHQTQHPCNYSIKVKTIEIIEQLMIECRFNTYHSACIYVFEKSKKNNKNLGFNSQTPEKFYQDYRSFKKYLHKSTQTPFL